MWLFARISNYINKEMSDAVVACRWSWRGCAGRGWRRDWGRNLSWFVNCGYERNEKKRTHRPQCVFFSFGIINFDLASPSGVVSGQYACSTPTRTTLIITLNITYLSPIEVSTPSTSFFVSWLD